MFTLQLATQGLSQTDSLFFNAMLRLANRTLKQPWELTNNPAATVVVVDVDEPEGYRFWEEQHERRLLVAFSKHATKRIASWTLQKPVPKVETLVHLLNQLCQSLHDTPTEPPQPHYPAHSFAACLQNQVQAGQPAVVVLKGMPALYVSPVEQHYYLPEMHRRACIVTQRLVCAANRGAVEVRPISTEQLRDIVRQNALNAQPLDALRWTAALCANSGQSLPDIPDVAPVQLTGWPNLTRLPSKPEHITLTAFMLKYSANVAMIAEKTRQPKETIYDFCNACLALGLLHVAQAMSPRIHSIPAVPTQTRGLFDRILQCLRYA